jgi:hypothetical protein
LKEIRFSLPALSTPSKKIELFFYTPIVLGDAHSKPNPRENQNLMTIGLNTHPLQRFMIFFRVSFERLIFVTKIFGMPIFKRRIYRERISRELTFVAQILKGLICEVHVSTAPNWRGQIFH